MDIDDLTAIIIEESINIHRELGPGLFESVYVEVLYHCLTKRGLYVEKQAPVPVWYQNVHMEMGFKADLIVENRVILEIKSVEKLSSVHHKQLLTYLKLTGIRFGLLINFNVEQLVKGLKRMVNGY